jgi:hypothetical protein
LRELGSRREKQGFPPGLKKRGARYKPRSCKSELLFTNRVRGRVLCQDRNWDQRSLVVINQGLWNCMRVGGE